MNPDIQASTRRTAEPHSGPWWKYPHMWMVVGGPAFMVVVSLTFATVAITGKDPVLDKEVFERDLAAARMLEGQARVDALIKFQPARQARNNAASPVVPVID
ncbi:nitrogen fixation protein FixH [Hydrogenophaga sp.]|uniref:nitrogen fixation protein FixH n=1 Tax=Hydrogenophaga sp. TaxID=1904254 RepID=UPI0019B7749F|nr:nitrogen fixation protein FixH [Hydrogenophaga sp.]MBD3893638.1 nitrogen fixation protein FixH [Hydrogenophaga sp.]